MQTAQIEFSKELADFIEEWKDKPGSLIMMLHRIQEEFSYIPREAAEKLSRDGGPSAREDIRRHYFLSLLQDDEARQARLAICLGTACYLKGAQDLIDEARAILNIKGEEVTDDGLFSIDEVRCLGCCGLAPVLMIGNEVFGKVTKDQLPENHREITGANRRKEKGIWRR